MIVIVFENPEPGDVTRKNVDIEVRMLIKGATAKEGDKIGTVLRQAMKKLRPKQRVKAYQMETISEEK